MLADREKVASWKILYLIKRGPTHENGVFVNGSSKVDSGTLDRAGLEIAQICKEGAEQENPLHPDISLKDLSQSFEGFLCFLLPISSRFPKSRQTL